MAHSLRRTSPLNLDVAIASGLRDLELLAAFYEQRGNMQQAHEIRDAVDEIKRQIAARALEESKTSEAASQQARPV